jgi:hypothetical protein
MSTRRERAAVEVEQAEVAASIRAAQAAAAAHQRSARAGAAGGIRTGVVRALARLRRGGRPRSTATQRVTVYGPILHANAIASVRDAFDVRPTAAERALGPQRPAAAPRTRPVQAVFVSDTPVLAPQITGATRNLEGAPAPDGAQRTIKRPVSKPVPQKPKAKPPLPATPPRRPAASTEASP